MRNTWFRFQENDHMVLQTKSSVRKGKSHSFPSMLGRSLRGTKTVTFKTEKKRLSQSLLGSVVNIYTVMIMEILFIVFQCLEFYKTNMDDLNMVTK